MIDWPSILQSKRPCKVTVDHIPMKNEVTTEEGETNSQSWKQYIEHFTSGDEPLSADCMLHMKEFPFFVKRWVRLVLFVFYFIYFILMIVVSNF